jgi:hypothetical protein
MLLGAAIYLVGGATLHEWCQCWQGVFYMPVWNWF